MSDLLQMATNHLNFFGKVSELLMRIGRSSSIHQDFVALYPTCNELHSFMCEYLILVVRVCQKIVVFETKPSVSQLVSSFTTSFDSVFKPLEDQIVMWSKFIDEKVRLLTAHAQICSEKEIPRMSKAIGYLTSVTASERKRLFADRRLQLLIRLSPHQDEFDRGWRRQRRKGFSEWILKEDTYLQWKNPVWRRGNMSLIGSIGSGKSVALASIVGDLHSQIENGRPGAPNRTAVVAAIFCQYDRSSTLDAGNILGSITHQIVRQLDEQSVSRIINDLDDATVLAGQIATIAPLLPRNRHYYFVIDGLEDCTPIEADEVLRGIHTIARSLIGRVCFSSRVMAEKLAHLGGPELVTFIHMANPARIMELNCYIEVEVDERAKNVGINPSTKDLIKRTLQAGAQGM